MTPEEKAREWVLRETNWVENDLWLAEANDCKRAYEAGYRAAQEWISVKTRLPEESGWYLCAIQCFEKDGSARTPIARDLIDFESSPYNRFELPSEHYYMGPFSDAEYRVTHWQPLPEAPKEQK